MYPLLKSMIFIEKLKARRVRGTIKSIFHLI